MALFFFRLDKCLLTYQINLNFAGKDFDEEFDFSTIEYPLNDINFKYEGSVQNGIPWGNGTLTYQSGEIYIGQFENGTRNGYGVLTYGEDDIHKRHKFEGGFIDDKRSGGGKLIWKNGAIFEGIYENDFQLTRLSNVQCSNAFQLD